MRKIAGYSVLVFALAITSWQVVRSTDKKINFKRSVAETDFSCA
jgi:hypothetical protein